MYLLKTLSTRNDTVVAQNGIKIVNMWCSRPTALKFKVFNTFWGDTDIQVKYTTGIAKFTKIAQNLYLLSYANHFEQTDLKDGFKQLDFFVGDYQPENVEGYILFIENEKNIETNGEVIFNKHPHEIVVLLKDGQYLDFSGKRAVVQKDTLLLQV